MLVPLCPTSPYRYSLEPVYLFLCFIFCLLVPRLQPFPPSLLHLSEAFFYMSSLFVYSVYDTSLVQYSRNCLWIPDWPNKNGKRNIQLLKTTLESHSIPSISISIPPFPLFFLISYFLFLILLVYSSFDERLILMLYYHCYCITDKSKLVKPIPKRCFIYYL